MVVFFLVLNLAAQQRKIETKIFDGTVVLVEFARIEDLSPE